MAGSSEVLNLAGKGEILVGSASESVAATAAAGEEIITITDTRIEAGDIAISCQPDAANTSGTLAVVHCYVSADSTLKVVVSNVHASAALTAESMDFKYVIYSASTNNRA